MRQTYRSMLWAGVVAVGVAACGDNVTIPTATPPAAAVHSVSVAPDGSTIAVGATLQMVASVNADAGVSTAVDWNTTAVPAAKGTLSSTGLFTAVGAGAVAIQACSHVNPAICGGATVNISAAPAATYSAVNVTPATASLPRPGTGSATLQLAASVQGTNSPAQTVTWSQPAGTTGVLTVNASTGLVTYAAASTGGTVVVSACSTVATNVCGFSAITITIPSPSTVSIASVTWVPANAACAPGAGPSVPVTLTNVRCQIEVTANVNAGDQTLSRIDALIGGQVVASQTFPGTSAANGGTQNSSAPVNITLSVNTAQVRRPGGAGTPFVPVVFNGNQQISLNLYVAGASAPLASNAVPVVMNNSDAMTAPTTLAPASTTVSAPGNGTSGGVTWYTGSSNISGGTFIAYSNTAPSAVGGVTYTAGGTAGCAPSSGATSGAATTGITLAGVFTCGTAPAGFEGSLTTTTNGFAVSYAPAVIGPDGTPLTPPAAYSTTGSAFNVPINAAGTTEQRWNMLVQNGAPVPTAANLTPIWIDNKAPATSVTTVAFNSTFDQPWINSTSYNLVSNVVATDGGSSAPPIPTILPVRTAVVWTGACSGANLPNPSGLAETVTSNSTDGWRICGRAVDAIGNTSTSGASNYFGVDNGTPAIRFGDAAAGSGTTPVFTNIFAGSALANQTSNIYLTTASVPKNNAGVGNAVFGIEAQDFKSGFNQNGLVAGIPATQTLVRLAPGGVPCPAISGALSTVLSDNWVRSVGTTVDCALNVGYYNYTAFVTDRAGNVSSTITRNIAVDVAAPVASSVGLSNVFYTATQPAPFNLFGSDDLEVIESDITLNYGGMNGGLTGITYPLNPITGAARWDGTLTNILAGSTTTQVSYLLGRFDFTCTGAGAPYASCGAIDAKDGIAAEYNNFGGFTNTDKNPTLVSAVLHDVFGTPSAAVTSGILTAQTCAPAGCPTTGTGQVWSGADIVTWKLTSGIAIVPGGSATAEHKASTSIVVPYFDSVLLARQYGTSLVVCGAYPAPVLTDNGLNRFWTYTLSAPTTGPCAAVGGLTYRAIGIKTGAALVTGAK